MKCIAYKEGYKYQLVETYSIDTAIRPENDVGHDYISLMSDGQLTIKKGYAWDGASGASDIPSIMRASLVHDALYQLMREEFLHQHYRKAADRLLRKLCQEDGMLPSAAWIVYYVVRLFGERNAQRSHRKPVMKAPESCNKNNLG